MTIDPNKFFDLTTYTKALNLDAVSDANRKTVDALKKANSIMTESLNALAARQVELAQSAIETGIEGVRELGAAKGAEDFLAKQSALFQQTIEKSIENARELAAIATTAQSQAADVVTKQFLDNVTVLSDTAGKTAAKATEATKEAVKAAVKK